MASGAFPATTAAAARQAARQEIQSIWVPLYTVYIVVEISIHDDLCARQWLLKPSWKPFPSAVDTFCFVRHAMKTVFGIFYKFILKSIWAREKGVEFWWFTNEIQHLDIDRKWIDAIKKKRCGFGAQYLTVWNESEENRHRNGPMRK